METELNEDVAMRNLTIHGKVMIRYTLTKKQMKLFSENSNTIINPSIVVSFRVLVYIALFLLWTLRKYRPRLAYPGRHIQYQG